MHLLASIVPWHRAPLQSGERSLIAAAKMLLPWLFVGLKPINATLYVHVEGSEHVAERGGKRTCTGDVSLGAELHAEHEHSVEHARDVNMT